MDISNRSVQPQPVAPGVQPPAPGAHHTAKRSRLSGDKGKWGRIGSIAAVAAVAILILGVITYIATSSNVKPEKQYVDSSRLQAVFLNTGQVYFGNIKSLNNRYLVLTNIYYLQTSGSNGSTTSSSANNSSNVQLVKLGCELHEPLDQMIINRDQITFWENLGEGGQVAKAVANFEKENPQGQKCADQSSAASTTSGSSTQNAGSSSSSSTNSSKTNP